MPVYDWDATSGKTYSLVFVELRRPGLPCGIVVHYVAYNVRNGTAVTKDLDTTLGGWRAPTHGRVGSSGLHVHLLFEHNTDLTVNLSAGMRIASSDTATDLTAFMATVGLDNATLVSLNWMAVRGSILSRASTEADRCVRRSRMAFLIAVTSSMRYRTVVVAGTTQAVRTFSKAGRRPQVYSICATCPSIPPAPPSSPCLRPRVA